MRHILVGMILILLITSSVNAQDGDSDIPDGTFALSSEAETVYNDEIASNEDLTEAEQNTLSAIFNSCTSIIGLRTFFTTPDVVLPDNVQVEQVNTDDVNGAWFIPEITDENKVLLYIHGGAFIFNSVETYTPFMMWLANYIGYTIFAVEYRLAPEHPFPSGLDDVETSYRWLLDEGFTPNNIALGGDSAGGNLAIELLLRLQNADETMPAGAWLYAPVVDFTRSSTTELMLDSTGLLGGMFNLMNECYLEDMPLDDPQVSPLFADLQGLPPLYLTVGTREAGLGSISRFARLARNSDVDVTLDVWDGMWHVWTFSHPLLPESIMLYEDIALWLQSIMDTD